MATTIKTPPTSADNAAYQRGKRIYYEMMLRERPKYAARLKRSKRFWTTDHICYDDSGYGRCELCSAIIPDTLADYNHQHGKDQPAPPESMSLF